MLFLITTVVLLRVLSYFFPLPLNLRQFELFDPIIYGSGDILRSLGDLLLNAICFVWLILFVRQQLFEKIKPAAPQKINGTIAMLAGVALLLVTATLTAGHMVRSLVADGQITFDVVDFATLNGYSVAGFLGLCSIGIGYFLFAQVLLYLIKPVFNNKIKLLHLHFAVIVASLLILSLRIGNGYIGFELFLMGWLQLFLLLLNNRLVSMPDGRLIATRLIFLATLFFSRRNGNYCACQHWQGNGKKAPLCC